MSKTLNTYVITLGAGVGLMDEPKQIVGFTPLDALKRSFDRPCYRVTGVDRRYADIILVKGSYSNGMLRPDGRYLNLCFRWF